MTDTERDAWNRCRFVRGDPGGHYESYFQRANHPDRPLAFWIRYTVLSPRGRPADALGELWAIYFDGEAGCITAAKSVVPIAECRFGSSGLDCDIGAATLRDGALQGDAASGGHHITWSLRYQGDQPPLLLLPRAAYAAGFPKAKALVGTPLATYAGALTMDGQPINVTAWRGSQNHNWGSRHTDDYAWGQVAGFDDAPDAFLECSSARVKVGPLWIPRMTLIVLRLDGEEFVLNSYAQALRATGEYGFFAWSLASSRHDVRIRARIEAPSNAFVGLRYGNPPGGYKTCLNTKLARCELTVERPGRPERTLSAQQRAAFEILTDRTDHGVSVVA